MYRIDERVSWPVERWYAAGQTGQSVTDFGFGRLLFVYYNQVLGPSRACTGLGVAVDIVGLEPASTPGEAPVDVLNHFGASYRLNTLLIVALLWVILSNSRNSRRHAPVLIEHANRCTPGASLMPPAELPDAAAAPLPAE